MKTSFYLSATLAATTLHAATASFMLPASAHNHTVKFTATAAHVELTYGDYSPDEGRKILVLAATWENIIDPTLADKRNLPYRVTNDDFRGTVQLIVDGQESVPALVMDTNTANLDPTDPDLVGKASGATDAAYIRSTVGFKNAAGQRAQAYLALEKPGAKTSGDLLFAIPKLDWQSLELLYSDPLGGNFRVLLSGHVPQTKEPANIKPNEVFALAAVLVEDPAKIEATPPAGRRYVAVKFQGKSLLKVQDNAPPYDPSQEPGTQIWRPDPARWAEYRNSLLLIADGALPCAVESLSDAPDTAFFSPDTWSQHRLIYLVPAQTKSFDLTCFFATYTIPGIDHPVAPKALTFHLGGPQAVAPSIPAKPEAKIIDGGLELTVGRHVTVHEIAGTAAGENEKFVVVDFVLRNAGTENENFRVPEQLVWFSKDGQVPPDEISTSNPLTAPGSFALAPGDIRSFQAVWRIPLALQSLEFGLKGNFVAEKFKLSLASH